MKIFTTLGILAAFGLVVACSSEGSSTGTGGAAGASSGGGGTTSGGTGGTTSGGTGGMAGSTSGGGTTSTGGAAGGGGSSACGDCLSASCTSELTACAGSADCLAALDCAQNCTDDTCINACIAQYPNAKTLIDAMLGCVQTNCATDCGM